MLLRLILVSAVVGLGVLPPARGDVAGWTHAVQTWLDERLAGCDMPEAQANEAIADDAPASLADPDSVMTDEELQALITAEAEAVAAAEPTVDSDFAAVLDEWVSEFVREQSEFEAELAAALGDIAAEPSEPVATPSMAYLPEAELEPYTLCEDNELAASLEWQDELGAPAETVAAPSAGAPAAEEESPTLSVEIPTAGTSLGAAVRLTRDAVAAWMNLLQSPALVTISR